VRSFEDRTALALLMTFRGWRPMREWLAKLLPGAAPEDRFAESLARLGEEGRSRCSSGPRGRPCSILMKSDGDRSAWRRSVRESFEVAKRGDWAVANALDRTLREHPLLQPLFNG
jgi:hypothetical protein